MRRVWAAVIAFTMLLGQSGGHAQMDSTWLLSCSGTRSTIRNSFQKELVIDMLISVNWDIGMVNIIGAKSEDLLPQLPALVLTSRQDNYFEARTFAIQKSDDLGVPGTGTDDGFIGTETRLTSRWPDGATDITVSRPGDPSRAAAAKSPIKVLYYSVLTLRCAIATTTPSKGQ